MQQFPQELGFVTNIKFNGKMYTIFAIACTLGLAAGTTVGSYGGQDYSSFGGGGGGGDYGGHQLSLGGGGGGYGGGLSASLGDISHAELSLGGGGGGGSYSGPSSYETSDHGGGGGSIGTGGGDFHHGVSVVGGGGDQKGTTFDLTHHGGGGHSGPFGGSFVASAKYEGHSGIAHKVADGDAHGGLITFGSPHYTDVLGAGGNDGGSYGGGSSGGEYKWGFSAPVQEYN